MSSESSPAPADRSEAVALVLEAQRLIRRRAFAEAERLLLQAVVLFRTAGTEDDLDYSVCLNNLGSLYHVRGDAARAEPLLREVVEMRRRLVGPVHPAYRRAVLDLAAFYRSCGDLVQAEAWQRQAEGSA